MAAAVAELSRKDFTSDQDVRWCPGCGDYSVLANVQRVMPELGIPARELRVRLRDRLLEPLPVLHEHLRLPHHPRSGARLRDRHQGQPPGALGLGRDGRRRRALDRRQPPAARGPAQSRSPDPALQQPRLRADQGPVLADLAHGHEDEVDARRRDRPPDRPDRLRARRRRHLRGAHHRRRRAAPAGDAAARARAPRDRLRRDPPELPGLQRRRVDRGRGPQDPRRGRAHAHRRPAARLRREGTRARASGSWTACPRSWRCPTAWIPCRWASPCTTSATRRPPTPSRWRRCSAPTSRFRSACSARSRPRPTTRCSRRRCRTPSSAAARATCAPCSHSGDTWTVEQSRTRGRSADATCAAAAALQPGPISQAIRSDPDGERARKAIRRADRGMTPAALGVVSLESR